MPSKTKTIAGLPALGDSARDRITGFAGVVIGECHYLTGCTQVLIIPAKVTAEGKRPEGEWFDIDRCEITERATFAPAAVASPVRPGSDKQAPKA